MTSYMYHAEPRALTKTNTKAKYRDGKELTSTLPRANIHFDKRVVRGNTYASTIISVQQQTNHNQTNKNPPTSNPRPKRRAPAAAPSAAAGRSHVLLQTDDYLEELADEIFEQDNTTQTQGEWEDLPVPPIFVAKPMGVDAATCIEGVELFDFELAVQPVLEVLVGKAVEQARVEVMEEEEIARLETQRNDFEQKRNALLIETQRMEAAAKRRHEEKERRVLQEKERLAREAELAKKVSSKLAANSFTSELQTALLKSLTDAGHFYDPITHQITSEFMPWLLEHVSARLDQQANARAATEHIIDTAVKALIAENEERLRKEEEERRERIRLAKEAEEEARRVEEEKARVAREEAEAKLKAEADALEAERLAEEEEERREREELEKEEGEEEEEEEEEEDE